MLWGKLIDHDRCIGCHACSVACKSENQVPLGVFRTWVKQVEKGHGFGARRHFGVMRCNMCDQAPCVAICPTAAMHRRPDGIVDFDGSICIGCKACIQGCPYDAIYIDPTQGTAAKCNFCAHRIEVGLEPACVAACPTDALQVSDLEDSESIVSRAVSRLGVAVRKPELETRPKVFYKGADESVLDPHLAQRPLEGIWGRGRELDAELSHEDERGPRSAGAPAAARVAYDVPREGAPWGWKIVAYLLTKAVAGGAMMVGGGLQLALGDPGPLDFWPALWAIALLGITSALLVFDLKRPERFLLLLTHPNRSSWLVKGAFVLMGATVVAATAGLLAIPEPDLGGDLAWRVLGALQILLGGAAAGYTAFLFGQAKGRRLWQSPLLLPHLVVQAVVAGSAALILLPGLVLAFQHGDQPGVGALLRILGAVLGAGLLVNALMIAGELTSPHDADARMSIEWMQAGERGQALYLGALALGHVFPFVALAFALLVPEGALAVGLAAVAALAGLWIWDQLYVAAGQAPPLS